ncbi:MAG: hypothetical protein WAQ24_02115 [Candidatus Saccharimonadales bacterium]
MRETDSLFARRQEALVQRFGELERLQQLNPLVDQVVARVVEADTHVSTPGLGHIKTALRRVAGDIPTGKAFASAFYDTSDSVVSDFSNPEDLETSTLRQPVRSRVFVIADNESEGGKVGKKIEEWLDGKKEAKSKVIIHTMTSGGAISFDIHSITFAAVKVEGGGTYCYEIVPNDNKGKIIATEAMQNEFGDIREKFGYIDNCSVKAVELSPIDRKFVEDELKRITEVLPKPVQPEKIGKVDKIRKKLGAMSAKLSHSTGNKVTKSTTAPVNNPLDKK